MRTIRICAVLGCLAVLAGSLVGAEERGGVDHRPTIRVTVPDANVTRVWERSTREVYEEFVRTHPGIRVVASEGLTMENVGNAGQLLGIAGGVSPDVFSLYYQNMHSYIEQGFVAPVGEYLDGWEGEGEIPDQLWPVVTGDDGERYGAIYTWPTLYLVYRRDLFEEAGLDPDRPPKNWDELYEYSRQLSFPDMIVETAADKLSGFGRMGMFLQTSGSWIFSNFVWQAGGDIVKRRPDGKWEAVFDTPEAVEALEYYNKMRWQEWTRCKNPSCKNVTFDIPSGATTVTCPECGDEYAVAALREEGRIYKGVVRTGFGGMTTVATYHKTLGRGEVAMALVPLRNLQEVLAENIVRVESLGVAPLPAGPTGIRASIVDGDVWCIGSGFEDDKAKMDACWEYIRFMTSKRAIEIETKIYVESGYGRFVRNPHWLKEFGYDEYFGEISPQQLEAYDTALDFGRPEPFCPGYAAMSNEMDMPVSKVLRTEGVDCEKELKEVVKYVNLHFFKLYPEEKMRIKRRVSLVVAIVFAAALALAGYLLVRSLAARVSATKSGLSAALKASKWKHFYAWLFLTPAVGTILLWSYIPLGSGSLMSFYEYRILDGLSGSPFIGLDNFIEAVSQKIFWQSMFRTFTYTAMTLSMGFVAPIVLALFLSEVPRLKITFRMLFYLPALTSALVLMFLWKELMYNPTAYGLLNQLLAFFGVAKQTWLQDPKLAMLCIVIPGVWAGAGPGSIIYLAALKTVPDELYEAAEMDGAGTIQKIYLVTLPYLKALIIINFLGAFIGSFHATQNIFVMTMGGPEKATHTLSLEIFFNAFLYLKFGYATAMAWIMGSMLIGFTLYQLRIFQKVQFTAAATKEVT